MRLGQTAEIPVSSDSLEFLLKARTLRADVDGADANALIVNPNRTRDKILLSVPPRTAPGEYTATVSATSDAGEQRSAHLNVIVRPMVTVPNDATRPPVVLLNGWETGITGFCNISSSSAETFGNLSQYLISDGVPVVYFFDNCAVDPNQTIEQLGNDLGAFLNTIKFDNGDQVTQIDLVGFSLGGLIARSYLAGLQPAGTVSPPATTLVRDLILIATPNFGSFVAGNYAITLEAAVGTQSAEIIPGSSFLWNVATWNQRGDDLRGVNALAIAGNAGVYLGSLDATTQLNNASDGLVSLTSAALGFALLDATPTRVVPYCHVDPSVFVNIGLLGPFLCNAAGIANVTSTTQETGEIVRSFLAGTTDWQSVGTAQDKDPWLSKDGGIFFAMEDRNGNYLTDLTAVNWGTIPLANGADIGVVYFTDFVSGAGDYQATSTSIGTIDCATLTEGAGYFSAARCKINPAIFRIGPDNSAPGRVINAGSTITITGYDFGDQCGSCSVVAVPAGSSTPTVLNATAWSNTSISAVLPASMTGLLTIQVTATPGKDAITIMTAAPGPDIAAAPASLQFSYTTGGATPAAQTIDLTNSGTGTLSWTATSSQSWLTVSPSSGTAPATLTVSVSPGSLGVGSYSGTIQVAATGASNSPLAISVSLTVSAGQAAAKLAVTPQSLTFNYAVGASTPAAQNVSITNSGTGTLAWTAASSVYWAHLSAGSGTAPSTLAISVNPANLAAGTYTGNATVTASGATGSPAPVSVTLVVTGTQAAPVVGGVTNGASFAANTFAAATWISIFGTNLSATTANWNDVGFANNMLPTSLDGVSVTIDGVPAYVDFISAGQINVLAPDDSKTGPVTVVVTTAGQKSNTFTTQKQQFAPAWFTMGDGKHAAAEHTDYSLVGAPGLIKNVTTTPAKPGETILLYGTGFGPSDPASPTANLVTTAEPLANTVTVTIGGQTATVAYAGLVGSGLYQLNVTVPSGLADGDAAVVATIGGVESPAGVAITIQQ